MKLTVIDCTASWCGPCKQIGPRFEEMALSFPFVQFYKLDVDEAPQLAQALGVTSMPTFLFFRGGVLADRFSGADENTLRRLLQQHGSVPPTAIPPQAKVVALGLVARPDLNGREGVVVAFDAAKGRYTIALKECGEAPAETLALKRDNLLQQLTVGVTINGARESGFLKSFDGASSLYGLLQEDGRLVHVPLESVTLPAHSTGLVVGLVGAAEHNGKSGFIVSFDETSERYVVAIDGVLTLRLKRSNLRA